MAGNVRFSSILFAVTFFVTLFASAAFADVTGSFGTHISFHPQTTSSELSIVDFDIENALDVTTVISGLSVKLHAHFGIAGIEDVIITADATMGILDVESKTVFGRFPFFGFPIPVHDQLRFFGQQVKAQMTLGGVAFTNIALIQDGVALFVGPQTPGVVFGDVMRLSGQTISGITITAETGICVTQDQVDIKKHQDIFDYTVNFFCSSLFTGKSKPDILFDYEDLLIEAVPIAPGITADGEIYCDFILALFNVGCFVDTFFDISGGPIPFAAEIELLQFSDPFDFNSLIFFNGAKINLTTGSGTFIFNINEDGTLGNLELLYKATLNPESNPATLSFDLLIAPGVGVLNFELMLEVVRSGLTFTTTVDFIPGPSTAAVFNGISFGLATSTGLVDLNLQATFNADGLEDADLQFKINF
ncbi:hypothetical protein HY229_02890 [Candidatus Acetothermia bacterium]|nr:hypothetical protein [Candidatus Acetothermia bacterium]MBI3643029.1 hypothetical protein [Candidatus Acetothermia bacterium]